MSTVQDPASDPSDRSFPIFRFKGSHRAIGEQYGEACRDLIHHHLQEVLTRLSRHGPDHPGRALQQALMYQPFVLQHAPFFDQEIRGLAHAAGLSLAEAYLLQLRAEAARPLAPPEIQDTQECTTFTALAEATANGIPLIGQNADLPAFYAELGVVVEITPPDKPAVLMLTPAGQISYIGINDRGLGTFGNFLVCDGWRLGFPRYLFSRFALTRETVDDAIAALRSLTRASSRNLIMLDARNTAADFENTPTRDARLDPVEGLLAHANHYVADTLKDAERAPPKGLANSRVRLRRMQELLNAHRGRLDARTMQDLLRDRAGCPDALCRMAGDDPESDTMTIGSVIAEPTEGRIHVAVGPPNQHPYRTHQFC